MKPYVTWKEFWKEKRNRIYFYKVAGLFGVMFLTVFFTLGYVEQRHGFTIEEWAKGVFGEPLNFSIGIFLITYFAMVFAIWEHCLRPFAFMQVLICYSFMQITKCILLLLIPLDPSPDILPLNDPILETLFYGGNVNLKDLFFSGHVATVCIAGLFTRSRAMKYVFLVLGIALAFMLAQQRVHYVLDCVAAPVFAWLAFRLSSLVAASSSKSGFLSGDQSIS